MKVKTTNKVEVPIEYIMKLLGLKGRVESVTLAYPTVDYRGEPVGVAKSVTICTVTEMELGPEVSQR